MYTDLKIYQAQLVVLQVRYIYATYDSQCPFTNSVSPDFRLSRANDVKCAVKQQKFVPKPLVCTMNSVLVFKM